MFTKPLSDLTPDALSAFVETRRVNRLVHAQRKPQRNTVKSMALAWNLPEEVVAAAAKELLDSTKRTGLG
jgi:hypothetical protein